MLPVRDSLQQRVTGMDGRSFSLKFIDTLLKLSDSNNWIASFLPFLIICKHPLVRDHFSNQTPHSAFTFSLGGQSNAVLPRLHWDAEMAWMNRYPDSRLLSWRELELLMAPNVATDAPYFASMCLNEAFDDVLDIFLHGNMIDDNFCRSVLNAACLDVKFPRLRQAYDFLRKLLYLPDEKWNLELLRRIPNISVVLVTFLSEISRKVGFTYNEDIISNMILLIIHLEGSASDVEGSCKIASERMRSDFGLRNTVRYSI
jgi:hypothetical protein